MISGLIRFILFRVLGARVMLALAAFGWLRKMLAGRKGSPSRGVRSSSGRASGAGSGYQPSQGESQIVHREPR
jgi:hypothetical protein